MQNWAVLIQALASLLWPLTVLIIVFIFRTSINDLFFRLKKGKAFGGEIELSDRLDQLQNSADKVKLEAVSLPRIDPDLNIEISKKVSIGNDLIQKVIDEAGRSPKAALMMLAVEIERAASEILANTGHIEGRRRLPLVAAINELNDSYGLPAHIPSTLRYFSDVRNRLIHRGQGTDEDILRAVDSGITILHSLLAVPHEVHVVHKIGVRLFSDEGLTQPITAATGIILESISGGRVSKIFRIFPTTRTHFVVGKSVAWEWSFDFSLMKTWYFDEDSRAAKKAWDSSAEFIGRHLDDL